MRKKDGRFKKMYEIYLQGYSLAEVGAHFGVTRQSVYSGFKLREYELRKKKMLPFVLYDDLKFTKTSDGYLRATTSRKQTIFMHQYVWEKHNGKIPPKHDIHHKNHDKGDNRIENLELYTKSEHARKFSTGRNQYSK